MSKRKRKLMLHTFASALFTAKKQTKKNCHFHSSIYSNYDYLMFVYRLMALSLCCRMWNKYYFTSNGNILIKPNFFLFLEKCILIEFCVFSKYDINLSARLNFKLFFSFDLKRNINDKINMNPYL